MASDSQITDPVRGVSYPAQKLHALGNNAAWGGSGSRAVLFDLEQIFDAEADAIVEAPDVGHALQQRVVPVLEQHYRSFIADVPGGKPGATPSTYVLAAGYSDGKPFIVDIDPHGLIGHHEETGFQAVGSGSPMAQQAYALLAHFQMTKRSVDYGVVAALRVLDALDTSSPSVGGPMDICRITPDAARHFDKEEVTSVRDRVSRWIDLEQRAIDELFS
ncbi:20S proteasome subunit (alpha or beta) [Mycolicibacterium rhodesiae NBB3]|jgi:20S proteasome alpha/beta subunit|uniref:20S proteasome subunit (Alpha or beta) n=2 Tax=Mycolicibacterium rhodesiae TaxID=36814 RepID=G8RTQ3_MYCRN|nr:20S proteasome subunit (alpha or beta) [Mycolicibacterium rhodesiae NBB3]